MRLSNYSYSPLSRLFMSSALLVALFLLLTQQQPKATVDAFQAPSVVLTVTRRSLAVHAALQQQQQNDEENRSSGRRSFFREAAAATAAAAAAGLSFSPGLVFAVEDLAMPTAEEQTKMDDEAMAERLRKKAELKKKAAAPANYKDSLTREMAKKSEMNSKSKEERRNAMCEELGRGC